MSCPVSLNACPSGVEKATIAKLGICAFNACKALMRSSRVPCAMTGLRESPSSRSALRSTSLVSFTAVICRTSSAFSLTLSSS